MKNKSLPDFSFEKSIWKLGYKYIAGLDEVGRGSFAGPVVAGCVVYDSTINYVKKAEEDNVIINDSKILTPKNRLNAFNWITDNCLVWGIGESSVSEINNKGIKRATDSAFRRVVRTINKGSSLRVEYLLIDAFYIPYIRDYPSSSSISHIIKQKAIVKGDQKSFSIASASIVAKVLRDKIMLDLSQIEKYKMYCWDKNKGYGTKMHRGAINKFGICKHHRTQFVKTYFAKNIG